VRAWDRRGDTGGPDSGSVPDFALYAGGNVLAQCPPEQGRAALGCEFVANGWTKLAALQV